VSDDIPRLELRDSDDQAGVRTTARLIASLAARLSGLFFVSGAEAVGAQVAGFAVAGREVAATAEGARLRERLDRSRPGVNSEMIWEGLRLTEWLSQLSPNPILDDLADDLALLLAPDLADALRAMNSLPDPEPRTPAAQPEPVEVLDCLLGVWAIGRQIVAAIELLAATGVDNASRLQTNNATVVVDEGSLLR
jgi:hypothetical protein